MRGVDVPTKGSQNTHQETKVQRGRLLWESKCGGHQDNESTHISETYMDTVK